MKTILVIAQTPALAAALSTLLDREQYRVLHETDLQDEDSVNPAGVDLCMLDAELTNVQPIRVVEKIRRTFANCPLIIYTNQAQWDVPGRSVFAWSNSRAQQTGAHKIADRLA